MRFLATFIALIFIGSFIPSTSFAQSTELSSKEAQIASIINQISLLQTQLLSIAGTTTLASSTTEAAILTDTQQKLKDFITGGQLSALLEKFTQGNSSNARLTEFLGWSLPRGFVQNNPSFGTSALTVAGVACPILTQNLHVGSQGEEVQSLQRFLKDKGLFNGDVTGFFGAITQAALQKWQSDNGVVSSGDSTSTGWGMVGPRTRAKIAEFCGITLPSNPTPSSSSAGSCVFSGSSYRGGTMVIPCMVSDPLSACFGGSNTTGSFVHPVCKNGTWITKETGAALSSSALQELEKMGGIVKTIYDPQGILSL